MATQLNKVVKKITPPKAGAGRPKGSLNKTTMAAKEAIAYAFEGLGGADGLVTWIKSDEKNKSAFYTSIYPKLLPLQVSGEGGGAVILQLTNADASL
jgi:hypothetical protein